MWIICAGMNRSGSTLQYQIAAEIAETYLGGKRVGYVNVVDQLWTGSPSERNATTAVVVKTHRYLTHPHGEIPDKTVVLLTYRDPRDMVFSQMKIDERRSARGALAVTKFAVMTTKKWRNYPACFCYQYENFFDSLENFVSSIASNLGLSLTLEEARTIAKKYEIPEQLARIKKDLNASTMLRNSAGSHYNSFTLLHVHHIASGTTGDWKKGLTRSTVAAIETELHDWMLERGYLLSLSPATRRLFYALHVSYYLPLIMSSRLKSISRRFKRRLTGLRKPTELFRFPCFLRPGPSRPTNNRHE
jgi:hypothetical protein